MRLHHQFALRPLHFGNLVVQGTVFSELCQISCVEIQDVMVSLELFSYNF